MRASIKVLISRAKELMQRQKAIVAMCLLLANINLYAAKLPQGKWEVKQITVEKSINDSVQITVYNTAAEVKDYIRFPQMLEVKNEQNILLHYHDINQEIEAEYTLDGDKLSIIDGPIGYSYSIAVTDENLVLTSINTYIKKPFGGQMENITEKWTFILQRKQTK